MDNVLKLCSIFHCSITDLINDKISDAGALDEEVKEQVVRFQKQKQNKMHFVTKIVYYLSIALRIGFIISTISGIFGALFLLLYTLPNTAESPLLSFDKSFLMNEISLSFQPSKILIETADSTTELDYNFLNRYIIPALIMSIKLLPYVFICKILKYMQYFFNNLYEKNTPFLFENIKYLKKIGMYICLTIVIPDLLSLFLLIYGIHLFSGISLIKYMFCGVVIALGYIFEYGYEIQKDSNSIMYE